jgi:hypothetical protein
MCHSLARATVRNRYTSVILFWIVCHDGPRGLTRKSPLVGRARPVGGRAERGRRSWLLAPGSWLLAPGSWLLAPGSWLLVPGSWLLAPGSCSCSWLLAPGSLFLTPGSFSCSCPACLLLPGLPASAEGGGGCCFLRNQIGKILENPGRAVFAVFNSHFFSL